MHIHGMQANAAGLHSMAAAENAATLKRSANVRKALTKAGLETENPPNPDAGFMVGGWSEEGSRRHQDQQDQQQNTPNSSAASQAEGVQPADLPISIWA